MPNAVTSHCSNRGCTGWAPGGTTQVGMTVDAYRTAPRGATSTTATPLAYSTTSRSPCLQRSTPESSANVETTWSTTWSSLLASGSSYVTSMLSPLVSRTRSTMPSMLPHTRRGGPPLGGTSSQLPRAPAVLAGGPFGFVRADRGHERAPRRAAVQRSLPVPEGGPSVAVSMSVKVAVSILSINGPVNRPSGPPLGVYR